MTKTKYLPFATIFKTLYGHAEQVIQLRNRKEQLRYYKQQEELFWRLVLFKHGVSPKIHKDTNECLNETVESEDGFSLFDGPSN